MGDVSLFIGEKNAWGKGFATLAIKLISYYVFSLLSLRKLSADAYQTNIASTKAFIKADYQINGALFRIMRRLMALMFVCSASPNIEFTDDTRVSCKIG